MALFPFGWLFFQTPSPSRNPEELKGHILSPASLEAAELAGKANYFQK
jgi:hypothetical protein